MNDIANIFTNVVKELPPNIILPREFKETDELGLVEQERQTEQVDEIPDNVFDQMMQAETGMSQADINKSIKTQEKKVKTDNKVIDNKKQSDKKADDIAEILCIKPKDLGEL